jgi:Regulator of chromosome condensation (RCC1) repeat
MSLPFQAQATSALLFLLIACSGSESLGPAPAAPAGSIIALGDRHVCLLRQNRTLCWGAGTDGQLGIGSTPADTTPIVLPDSIEFVALTAGQAHTCGLDSNGSAFCWGSDRDGQLGLGVRAAERCSAFPCATRPQPVAGNLRFTALTAGQRFTCGLTATGKVYCWGINDVGQTRTGKSVGSLWADCSGSINRWQYRGVCASRRSSRGAAPTAVSPKLKRCSVGAAANSASSVPVTATAPRRSP